MKPQITEITLGVDNLESAVHFYRDGLGFATNGIEGADLEHGGVAFFNLQSGLRLALRPRKSMARDIGLSIGARSPTEVTFGYNVSSKEEVDAILDKAFEAQAQVRYAGDNLWGGYSGYFQDPDQHLWEISWLPPISD